MRADVEQRDARAAGAMTEQELLRRQAELLREQLAQIEDRLKETGPVEP
jgi:hypothetical protein